ncbi:MAG TPA: hypothetical protein VGO40_22845, partial [Longimicrobium sp.]|nr:hypothetical protein [Longimicrobium sp.]
MSRQLMRAAALLGALAGTAVAGCADAQARQGGLASRVAAAPEGEVWMHFTSRPGVCGSENGISTSSAHARGRSYVNTGDDGDGRWGCEEGPVWVALERRGGRVEKVRMKVARGWSTAGRGRVTDLGVVGAREASEYLLALAERADGRVGEEAIVAATLADSVTTWPALLRLTRNTALPQGTRRSAVFWLSQQAGDRITRELSAFVSDSEEDR